MKNGLTELRTLARLLLVLLMPALAGCVYVLSTEPGAASYAYPPAAESRLGELMAGSEPGGRALVVNDSRLALTARLDMIDAADCCIDVQYFIWQNDPSGILTIDRLLAAADRGVRVRALIDDVQLEGLISRLIALAAHPNVEVRIFNPFSIRFGFRLRLFRLAEFAIDGMRLNHRMHNKLLVVDNQLAIMGGRNIGDDYFGLSERRNFIDTDLLLSGTVVPELSAGFDRYWNCRWAIPVEQLVNLSLVPDDLPSLRRRVAQRLSRSPELQALVDPARIEGLVATLRNAHRLDAASTVMDEPEVGWGDKPDELAEELTEVALSAERELLIVSPYLVLTDNLLGIADELTSRGTRIEVLTNSLASNDVVIAHAAYARFRQTILDSGVTLYEFRGDPLLMADDRARDFSLHSKYILFDEETVFTGSLNLDPRSLYLNTELGVVLRSASLVAELREWFTTLTDPDNAWRVRSTADGFSWESSAGTVHEQPAKSAWQRFRAELMTLLPLANQL